MIFFKKKKGLLKFMTAGSVDDGKSTLIGRLLFDTNNIFLDQLSSITYDNKINFALLLDGLESEKEQGITIDVAYRYFSTSKRKFIIVDTPGHLQYTRNMITAASYADTAIILIDVSKVKYNNNVAKILSQTKRHSIIIKIMNIKHLIVAINKMDIIHYRKKIYNDIILTYKKFINEFNFNSINFIPISALNGENLANKSKKISWYKKTSLMKILENIKLINIKLPFRFPIQFVNRHNDIRRYMGKIISGKINKNDKLFIYPSKQIVTLKYIELYNKYFNNVSQSKSVSLILNEYVDLCRGDILVLYHENPPFMKEEFEANLFWLYEEKLYLNRRYILKHSNMKIIARIKKIINLLDINTQRLYKSNIIKLNDIARVKISTQKKIFFDSYNFIKNNGNFILIDEITNQTVAGGIICL